MKQTIVSPTNSDIDTIDTIRTTPTSPATHDGRSARASCAARSRCAALRLRPPTVHVHPREAPTPMPTRRPHRRALVGLGALLLLVLAVCWPLVVVCVAAIPVPPPQLLSAAAVVTMQPPQRVLPIGTRSAPPAQTIQPAGGDLFRQVVLKTAAVPSISSPSNDRQNNSSPRNSIDITAERRPRALIAPNGRTVDDDDNDHQPLIDSRSGSNHRRTTASTLPLRNATKIKSTLGALNIAADGGVDTDNHRRPNNNRPTTTATDALLSSSASAQTLPSPTAATPNTDMPSATVNCSRTSANDCSGAQYEETITDADGGNSSRISSTDPFDHVDVVVVVGATERDTLGATANAATASTAVTALQPLPERRRWRSTIGTQQQHHNHHQKRQQQRQQHQSTAATGNLTASTSSTTATGGARRRNANLDRNERSANMSHLMGTARKIRITVNNRKIQLLPNGTVSGTHDDRSDYSEYPPNSAQSAQTMAHDPPQNRQQHKLYISTHTHTHQFAQARNLSRHIKCL